jgi:hypothetical protein
MAPELFARVRSLIAVDGHMRSLHKNYGNLFWVPYQVIHLIRVQDGMSRPRQHRIGFPPAQILHTSTTVAAVGAALSRSASSIFLPPVGGNGGPTVWLILP